MATSWRRSYELLELQEEDDLRLPRGPRPALLLQALRGEDPRSGREEARQPVLGGLSMTSDLPTSCSTCPDYRHCPGAGSSLAEELRCWRWGWPLKERVRDRFRQLVKSLKEWFQ